MASMSLAGPFAAAVAASLHAGSQTFTFAYSDWGAGVSVGPPAQDQATPLTTS